MAETKDKVVTLESLSALHEYNKENYMTKLNPIGVGSLSMNRKADTTIGGYSVAEGSMCEASGGFSHAEGCETTATGEASHAEGGYTTASGSYSHTEGVHTTASGHKSHAEGENTTASGAASHAEGRSSNKKSDVTTSANSTEIQTVWETSKFSLANSEGSHVEGKDCLALGLASHAEGCQTIASGGYSHAEGTATIAKQIYSHAEGMGSVASGYASHAEGYYTISSGEYQHVQGKYNIEDTAEEYAHIVGNGNYDGRTENRSNAHTLDWDGNAWYAGDGAFNGTIYADGSATVGSLGNLSLCIANNAYIGGGLAVEGNSMFNGQITLLGNNELKLSEGQYGDTLPAAGNAGRIFFKKVTE